MVAGAVRDASASNVDEGHKDSSEGNAGIPYSWAYASDMVAIAAEACDTGQGTGRDSFDRREDGEDTVVACKAHFAQVDHLEKVWQEVPGTGWAGAGSSLEGGRSYSGRQRSFPQLIDAPTEGFWGVILPSLDGPSFFIFSPFANRIEQEDLQAQKTVILWKKWRRLQGRREMKSPRDSEDAPEGLAKVESDSNTR